MPPEAPQLRRQLLTWLLVPLFVLLGADTFLSYRVALSVAERAHDRALAEIARDVALHLRGDAGALALELPEEARRVLFEDKRGRIAFDVATAAGVRIAGEPIARAPRPAAARNGGEAFYDGELGGEPARIIELAVREEAQLGRPAALVHVAETMEQRTALAREILASVVLPQVLLILIAGLVVWVGVEHGLAPLQRLQRAIAERSHLDRRAVSAAGVPAEVRPLVHSINELLGRLDHALTLQGRFIADAAHQLKTPIAAAQAQLEVALREPEGAAREQAMHSAYGGLERLARIASQLLSLARNEPEAAGSLKLGEVDLDALGLEVATHWVPEALKRGVDLGFEASGTGVRVQGDAARLRELFDNLVDNAVRYSRGGGRVTVRVLGTPQPALEVSDDGPSIPPEERERVFERFHRLLGTSRDGSGLGLAIAREIARLHGTDIGLREDADGIGNTFSVVFPP